MDDVAITSMDYCLLVPFQHYYFALLYLLLLFYSFALVLLLLFFAVEDWDTMYKLSVAT